MKGRRRLLVGIALVLAAADGIWWASRQHGERQDYELGTTPLAVTVADDRVLPLFDEAGGRWLLAGKPLASLRGQVRRSGDGKASYVVVRLAADAGQTSFRHALLALVRDGHCLAGIATGVANRPDGERVPVHRLVWVRDDAGDARRCSAAQ
ncbi:MAG: hypothetical protein KGM17_09595 [Sphingomonadales bacterium]|nr:hypothetical protein [Sphingomonadales bacterium]